MATTALSCLLNVEVENNHAHTHGTSITTKMLKCTELASALSYRSRCDFSSWPPYRCSFPAEVFTDWGEAVSHRCSVVHAVYIYVLWLFDYKQNIYLRLVCTCVDIHRCLPFPVPSLTTYSDYNMSSQWPSCDCNLYTLRKRVLTCTFPCHWCDASFVPLVCNFFLERCM